MANYVPGINLPDLGSWILKLLNDRTLLFIEIAMSSHFHIAGNIAFFLCLSRYRRQGEMKGIAVIYIKCFNEKVLRFMDSEKVQ